MSDIMEDSCIQSAIIHCFLGRDMKGFSLMQIHSKERKDNCGYSMVQHQVLSSDPSSEISYNVDSETTLKSMGPSCTVTRSLTQP